MTAIEAEPFACGKQVSSPGYRSFPHCLDACINIISGKDGEVERTIIIGIEDPDVFSSWVHNYVLNIQPMLL